MMEKYSEIAALAVQMKGCEMKKSRVIAGVIGSVAAGILALAVAGPANATTGPQVSISPLGVITTSQFFSFFSPGGLSHSYTDNHTNTNNVTIGWTGATGNVGLTLVKGSYSCTLGPKNSATASKVCTGVPSGTITLTAVGNAGTSATFYDSYTI